MWGGSALTLMEQGAQRGLILGLAVGRLPTSEASTDTPLPEISHSLTNEPHDIGVVEFLHAHGFAQEIFQL